MAKIAGMKKIEDRMVPPERRWTVINNESGRRVYLPSPNGLRRPEAEALAERLRDARVVPEAALDRFGKFQEERLEDAIAAAEAPEEE